MLCWYFSLNAMAQIFTGRLYAFAIALGTMVCNVLVLISFSSTFFCKHFAELVVSVECLSFNEEFYILFIFSLMKFLNHIIASFYTLV